MNKRINELFGQALDAAVPYTWHNLDHAEVEKVMKVFAELIVQECIDTICDCSMEYCTRPQIVSEIKEHFGVEE